MGSGKWGFGVMGMKGVVRMVGGGWDWSFVGVCEWGGGLWWRMGWGMRDGG